MANQAPKELATKKKKSSNSSVSINKKSQKKVTKQVKKTIKKNKSLALIIAIALILGGAGGYFGYKLISKNDTFVMNDYSYINQKKNVDNHTAKDLYEIEDNTTAILFLNEEYNEVGATCVAFNSDISKDINITYFYREDISFDPIKVEKVDTSISGFYYASYSTKNIRYSNVELIRNIIVVEVEDNE